MDRADVIRFPRPDAALTGLDEAGAVALAEMDAAIALVAGRVARRVQLTALPFVDAVAAVGLANARAAGIAFRLDRPEREGVATVTIGPLDPVAVEPIALEAVPARRSLLHRPHAEAPA